MAGTAKDDVDFYKGIYKSVVRPALFRLDPEVAHTLVHKMFPAVTLLKDLADNEHPDERLSVVLAGVKLPTPVGLAAGFDKNGHLVSYLRYLGFSFAEIGSITGQATVGNPKPRLFRLPDDAAVINFMGLNGEGSEAVAARLAATNFNLPVAVNIAATNHPEIVGDKAVEDILSSFERVKNLPLHYVAINVSCPNTSEDVLKELDRFSTIFGELVKRNSKKLPIFLKLSPNSSDELLEKIVSLGRDHSISGYVCGNTSTSRVGLKTDEETIKRIGRGGLSGKPLKKEGLEIVRRVFRIKEKNQQIIGCGGIFSGWDAFEYICAGATAVQMYTALVYEGPFAPAKVTRELSELVSQKGVTLTEMVGSELLCQSTKSTS